MPFIQFIHIIAFWILHYTLPLWQFVFLLSRSYRKFICDLPSQIYVLLASKQKVKTISIILNTTVYKYDPLYVYVLYTCTCAKLNITEAW